MLKASSQLRRRLTVVLRNAKNNDCINTARLIGATHSPDLHHVDARVKHRNYYNNKQRF
jgi:hypothetical protein